MGEDSLEGTALSTDEGLTDVTPQPDLPITKSGPSLKKKARKKRKRSPRAKKTKRTSPEQSVRMRLKWQEPTFRAHMMSIQAENVRKRKACPQSARFGVPDGMRKPTALKKWAKAEKSAKKTMKELEKAGVLEGNDAKANEALETAIKVMRGPQRQEICLAAARLVLDFTKSKPASKTEMTVNKAEEWLAAVAATETNGSSQDDQTSGDPEAPIQ